MPRCPDCFVPLTRVETDGLKIATCPDCFGLWMAVATLVRQLRQDVEKHPDLLEGSTLEQLCETVSETHRTQALRCPACGKPMRKGRFHSLIPVVVDRCSPCTAAGVGGGVWLDAGELRLLRYLYHEMMTTEDAAIRARIEQIGGAKIGELEWRRRRSDFGDSYGNSAAMAFGGFDFPAGLP